MQYGYKEAYSIQRIVKQKAPFPDASSLHICCDCTCMYSISQEICTRFCFAVLCCGYTLTDFPISITITSLELWLSNDCPSASKATLMNMDKYFMWIHYERLHNHNKAKHNITVCQFFGIYCIWQNDTGGRYRVILPPWWTGWWVDCAISTGHVVLLLSLNLFARRYILEVWPFMQRAKEDIYLREHYCPLN